MTEDFTKGEYSKTRPFDTEGHQWTERGLKSTSSNGTQEWRKYLSSSQEPKKSDKSKSDQQSFLTVEGPMNVRLDF